MVQLVLYKASRVPHEFLVIIENNVTVSSTKLYLNHKTIYDTFLVFTTTELYF